MGSSLVLRIGMIVIGLALIVAIYLVGTRRNKGNRRFSKDGRLRQINPIDVVAGKTEAKSTPFNTDATLDSIDGPGIIDDAFDESSYNQDKLSNPVLNELAPHPGDDIGDLPKIEKSPKGKTKRKKQSGKQISQIEMSSDDEDFAILSSMLPN